ncbi:MAG TPA: hypothetical protein ENG87_02215 [Candidatus Pacearchaeota archaeon]|nr:hypothetical protein [Candidatus Pacearchaeota archaeon]
MARAKLKDPSGFSIEYYMENRLKRNLDDRVKPALQKQDKDYVICVDGREGCQPKGDKVLMADGSWKNIEEIKIGDEVLSPQKDGTFIFSKVLNTTKWFCDEIYDVKELNRNRKKLYSCSYNHLIPINNKRFPRINGKREKEDSFWEIKHYSAQEYSKLSKKGSKKNQTTILSFPINKFKNRINCRIEPYTLGVFLGDGHFFSKKTKELNPLYGKESITKGHWRNLKSGKNIWQKEHKTNFDKKEFLMKSNRSLGITTSDIEIINEIKKYYNVISKAGKKDNVAKTYYFSLNGELAKELSLFGLEGKGSGEKFIPQEALLSDLDYRKKLLAGLIDTDGYFEKKSNSFQITTKSNQLAQNIYSLVKSLGGRGSVKKITKKIKEINFEGKYFLVNFYLGNLVLPTKLKRKGGYSSFFYLSANRTSIDVIKTNKKEYVYGFELNSKSSWYITNDYVITHNSGKSWFAFQIGKYVDPTLNLNRVVFSPDDFRQAILKAKKGQCIIYDEAFTGYSSRSSLSPVNKVLVSLAMQMRQKNLFVIIVLPTIFLLDKYMAIFRTRGLFHIFESKGIRGYFKFYNSRVKKYLILMGQKTMSYNHKKIWTNFKGRFYGKFALGDDKVKDLYLKKKEKALADSEKTSMTSAQVRFREQRDLLIWLFRKYTKLTYKEIAEIFFDYELSMSFQQISKICAKFGEISTEKDKNDLKKDKNEEKSSISSKNDGI